MPTARRAYTILATQSKGFKKHDDRGEGYVSVFAVQAGFTITCEWYGVLSVALPEMQLAMKCTGPPGEVALEQQNS